MIEIVQVGHESEDYFLVHDPNTNDCPCGNSADLIALRDALLAKYPVERWEPLSGAHTDVWRCQVKLIDNYLRIYNEVTGGWEDVELPPTIRLCRLVEGA